MDKLDEILKYCEDEKQYYENPGTYLDKEYYIKCEAKVDILLEIVQKIKELKNANR